MTAYINHHYAVLFLDLRVMVCYNLLQFADIIINFTANGVKREWNGQFAQAWEATEKVRVDIGSHDSDSLLGTTRVVSGARMLMYWAGSSQMASPRERRPIRGHG